MRRFDLAVIGSGPAGQRAAVQASKLGARVALVDRGPWLGGVSVNTGTLPSKTLREAVIDLSGTRERALYGDVAGTLPTVTATQLLGRAGRVMTSERSVVEAQLARNDVVVLRGTATFAGPHALTVASDGHVETVEADNIIIAVGTVPGVPPGVTIDRQVVLTSDDVLTMDELPQRLLVLGAGVVGVEYATMFAVAGCQITLADRRPRLLPMVDHELADRFHDDLVQRGLRLHLGDELSAIERHDRDCLVTMRSGTRFIVDKVLVSSGRQGATGQLRLDAAGLSADARGIIAVDSEYRTSVPHIFAVGDVIGAPQLAATSAEQGRAAACHALGVATTHLPELFPYGIYAIPELAWVGPSEEQLTEQKVEYLAGRSRYAELARGQILGDDTGVLKLLFGHDGQRLLAVWCIGSQATALVHIGQAVMAFGGGLDYFLDAVFNYPTLAEAYKVAALDASNRRRGRPSPPTATR
jgi:NAD(P) transhydrogenase